MRWLAAVMIAACSPPAPSSAQAAPRPGASEPLRLASAIDRYHWKPLAGTPVLTDKSLAVTIDRHRIAVIDVSTLAGAIYDGRTHAWTPIQPPALPKGWSDKIVANAYAPAMQSLGGRSISIYQGSFGVMVAATGDYLVVTQAAFAPGMRYSLAKSSWETADLDGRPAVRAWQSTTDGRFFEIAPPGQNNVTETAAFAYDPARDRWDLVGTTPFAVSATSMCASEHRLASFGGDSIPNGNNWGIPEGAYEIVANGVTPLATAGRPSKRAAPTLSCSDTELYVWGGVAKVGGGGALQQPLRDGAVYTYATKTWSALPSPPADLEIAPLANAHAVAGKIVALGGLRDGRFLPPASGVVFDPHAGTWVAIASAGAPQPEPPCQSCGVSADLVRVFDIGGDRFILVGAGAAGSYDLGKRAWTKLDFPYRSARGVAWLDGELVVIGGVRPADRTGCYDQQRGRCDDGRTPESVVLTAN